MKIKVEIGKELSLTKCESINISNHRHVSVMVEYRPLTKDFSIDMKLACVYGVKFELLYHKNQNVKMSMF